MQFFSWEVMDQVSLCIASKHVATFMSRNLVNFTFLTLTLNFTYHILTFSVFLNLTLTLPFLCYVDTHLIFT